MGYIVYLDEKDPEKYCDDRAYLAIEKRYGIRAAITPMDAWKFKEIQMPNICCCCGEELSDNKKYIKKICRYPVTSIDDGFQSSTNYYYDRPFVFPVCPRCKFHYLYSDLLIGIFALLPLITVFLVGFMFQPLLDNWMVFLIIFSSIWGIILLALNSHVKNILFLKDSCSSYPPQKPEFVTVSRGSRGGEITFNNYKFFKNFLQLNPGVTSFD